MNIGFYSPYFDSLSGGERYVFTLASHWSRTHAVSIFWDDPAIIKDAGRRLHIDLSRVTTTENVFATRNIFRKLRISRNFDLIFFLTDGSIPTTFAKKNILHFQVPFRKIPYHPIKIVRFQAIVCNSAFTKKYLDRRVSKRSVIIYPPVEPITGKKVKKKLILSVGRFYGIKKQNVLIEAFKKGEDTIFAGYRLILAGGLLESDRRYFDQLKKSAKGFPIVLFPNIPFEKLKTLYQDAEIYWHAAGFGETSPEHMEHFGITTVEAMSAGCVPIVYDGGGQTEIVREGENGFFWKTTDELLAKTAHVIDDSKIRTTISRAAVSRSKRFSTEEFTHAFDSLLRSITK